MSGLPVEYEFKNDPAGQVTAADRDKLATRLGDAYAAGDVSQEDYQARLDSLFEATNRAELVPVMSGLPARYRSTAPHLATEDFTSPGEVQPLRPAPRGLVKAAVVGSAALLVLLLILAILL